MAHKAIAILGADEMDSEEEDEELRVGEGARGGMDLEPTSFKRRQSVATLASIEHQHDFTEAQLASASEMFREAWSRVQGDPWDAKSWQTLISEAQMQRAGRSISLREVYRVVLKQFPTSAKLWKELAEHELRQGHMDEVDAILKDCVLECPSVELFSLYVQRVRRANPSADGNSSNREQLEAQREVVTAAFEFAIKHVGLAVDATPLWWEYINYIQGWKEVGDTGNKLSALRKVYQRALQVPLDGLEEIWQSYEAWEKGLNEHLARQTLPALQPAYNQAKTVARERRALLDQQKLNRLAVPPTNTLEEKEQLGILRRRVDYERSNPEQVDPAGLKDRLRLCYRSSLAFFYRFPEVWHEFAQYEAETEDQEAAASLYERAIIAVPASLLLHLAYAELEESRGHAEHGAEILRAFLEKEPGTLGYVVYQQYVRRTQGKDAARRVFSSTKELRKKGTLSHQFYLAHARLEQHMNHSTDVAKRVLDYGLAQHPEFLQEPEYVLAFVDLLIQLHDEQNVRGLCDRALAAMGSSEAAKPVWDRFLEFEMTMASNRDMARVDQVQKRMAQVFPSEREPQGLMRLWKRVSLFGVDPGTEADELARQRYGYDSRDRHATALGRPVMITGEESIKIQDRGGDRGDGRDGGRVSGRRSGDSILAQIQHKRIQSLPEYLRRLYTLLPSHTGPPPDIDTIVRSLREMPMPPRPPPPPPGSRPPVSVAADGKDGTSDRPRRKRRWDGGGDDSEDSDGGLNQTPGLGGSDVFRVRQQENLIRQYGGV